MIGAAVMAIGGIAELFFGVKAEQKPLEEIAEPLTADRRRRRAASDQGRRHGGRARRPRGRFRPGPARSRTSPGMPVSEPSRGPDAEVEHEVAIIEQALHERGSANRRELQRRVGARYWGPGRFRAALRRGGGRGQGETAARRRVRAGPRLSHGATAGRSLKGTLDEFKTKNLSDWAAALTYYGLLSLFPAVIALVSIIGLVGDPRTTTQKVTEVITELGPESAAETFKGPVESIATHRGTAGVAFVLGLAIALWSASGYVGAFMRASNVIYDAEEERPFFKLRPLQVAITLTMVILAALLALGLVLTGPIVSAIADPIGIGSTAVTLWEVLKWPVMAAVFVLMVSVLYYTSPDASLRGFRWVTPGSIVAIVVWAARLRGVRLLRRQLRLLRQDLRDPRRFDRAPGLALDQQPRDPLRRGPQRAAGAGSAGDRPDDRGAAMRRPEPLRFEKITVGPRPSGTGLADEAAGSQAGVFTGVCLGYRSGWCRPALPVPVAATRPRPSAFRAARSCFPSHPG